MFFSGRSEIRNCPIKFPRIFFLSGWSKTLSGLLLFSSFPPFSGCDDERKRANHFRINQWSFSWNRCVLKRWPTSRLFFFYRADRSTQLIRVSLERPLSFFLFFFFFYRVSPSLYGGVWINWFVRVCFWLFSFYWVIFISTGLGWYEGREVSFNYFPYRRPFPIECPRVPSAPLR